MTATLILITLSIIVITSLVWPIFVGAPYVATSFKKISLMLKAAKLQPGETLYDLGAGDGRILFIAVKKFKAKAVGIEIDPIRYLWLEFVITILGLRKHIKIIFGNFFNQDLSKANVINCYLLPETNLKLEKKLKKELSHKARIVSNSFKFHHLKPIKQDYQNKIYLYRI
ncbi:MAG: class I SAM-dependent methyltransferase [bacterium]